MGAIRLAAVCLCLAFGISGCGGGEPEPTATQPVNTELEASADFDALVVTASAARPVAVLFTAPWSGPDQVFKPIVTDALAERNGEFDLVMVNVDDHPAIANRYRVLSIPTLAVFSGGELVDHAVGALPKRELDQFLETALEKESAPG